MRVKNQRLKIVVDILMTVALLFLMGYQFWGDVLHEWAGAAMLALFIAHHILNVNWYKALFKGRYTPVRVLGLIIDFAVLSAMLMVMYSGITMSRHVFAFLPINGGMALARRLHLLGSYWGFVLMSLHLGMHWSMIIAMIKKVLKGKMSKLTKIICPVLGTGVSGYGIYVFIHRDLLTYMLLENEFLFMYFNESKILFYIDYLAMMGLFVFVSHYISRFLRKFGAKKDLSV